MNTQTVHNHTSNASLSRTSIDVDLLRSVGQNPSMRDSLATSGWLLGLNGVHLGEDLRLFPGPNTVGSSAHCHVVITAPETGRQHAVIDVVSGESAILYPGSSQRPLFLNDEICERPLPLCHGDRVQIGSQLFAFVPLLPVPSTAKIVVQFLERFTTKTPCTLAWLIEMTGTHRGRDFRLFNGENRIGQQSGLEISLPDADLQPRHGVITRHQNNWIVVPISVTYPLFVNGIPSTGTALENGDILTLGEHEFLFRCLRAEFIK